MVEVRHPRLVAVVASAVLVLVLWVLSWERPQGGAMQVASQVLLPVPAGIGIWACAARLRASWTWTLPLALFVLCLPMVYEAWEDRSQPPGEERCFAVGFLPKVPDWFEHEGYLFAPLGVGVLGLAALASRPLRLVGAWTVASSLTWAVTFLARGVCVGT